MRRIVVTPAGRKRYMEILYLHLLREKDEKEGFQEWRLWINTCDKEDQIYCHRLAERHPDWITLQHLSPDQGRPRGNASIRFFFRECCDPDAVYLRLDDDIVWMQTGFVHAMFGYRLQNTQPFLVYANTFNNSLMSYLHRRTGSLPLLSASVDLTYHCFDPVSWRNGDFAVRLHEGFLASIQRHMCNGSSSIPPASFCRWELLNYERCSVNAVCWLGDRFSSFGGEISDCDDEEHWLSCVRPRAEASPCVIYGGTSCMHFAYGEQRADMTAEKECELLKLYLAAAQKQNAERRKKLL